MSDIQSRIERYETLAAESLGKAERTSDETARRHYMRLAESYLQLIDMEIRRMEIRGIPAEGRR